MKTRHFLKLCALLAFLTTCPQFSISFAQGTAVTYQGRLASGGGTSTGVYSVSGTIGQHDAGGPMTNGAYSLVDGFWVLPILVQTPEAPTLHITNAAPGFATIWWTPTTGTNWVLQQSPSLTPPAWTSAPSGTNNPAAVPATLPARFYRLFEP